MDAYHDEINVEYIWIESVCSRGSQSGCCSTGEIDRGDTHPLLRMSFTHIKIVLTTHAPVMWIRAIKRGEIDFWCAVGAMVIGTLSVEILGAIVSEIGRASCRERVYVLV